MLRKFLAPPVFADSEKTRVAALLNSILWAVIAIGTLYTLMAPFLLQQYTSAVLTASIVIVALLSRQLMIRGHIRAANITILIVFHIVLTISIVVSDGTFGASYFSLVMTTVIAGILIGGRGAYVMAVINALTALGITLVQEALPAPLIPQNPITFWSSLVVYLFFIAALQQASTNGFDKLLESLRKTQNELMQKNRELQESSVNLETRVAARTAELDAANQRNERRARQFEAISQVSHVINQTQNLENLLPQIAQVISQQFGFYHVGIFLMDDKNEYAILAAANSEGGQRMLARDHKLKTAVGIVGNVAGSGTPRIALNTGVDAIYFDNPDLPETCSEMALPLLRTGRQIMGVLDIQSREPNAFGQEDIRVLTTLSDQVTIAIDNARLFEETRKSLLEADAVYRRDIQAGWTRYTRAQKLAGIRRWSMKSSFLADPLDVPGAQEAIRSGTLYKKRAEIDDGTTQFTMPMKLRGEVVGVLNVKADSNREWSTDEMDIISAIVERAVLAIENARLLEESRKIAEKEHAIGEISAKIGAGTELETILKTAVRELGAQISGAQITVEIGGA